MSIFVTFSLCDDEGRIRNPVALEVTHAKMEPGYPSGIYLDVRHLDGERERFIFDVETRYIAYNLGGKIVTGLAFGDGYPPGIPMSKKDFRERFGNGRLLNEHGHFVQV